MNEKQIIHAHEVLTYLKAMQEGYTHVSFQLKRKDDETVVCKKDFEVAKFE